SAGTLTITGTAGTGYGYGYGYGSTHNTGVVVGQYGTISSSGTGIKITGYGTIYANATTYNHGVDIQGTVEATNTANVDITGFGGKGTDSNQGVSTYSTSNISAVDGDITIAGTANTATTGQNNSGISIGGTIATSGSTSAIRLEGTGGSGTNVNYGVQIYGSLSASGGDITITGDASVNPTTGLYNEGVAVQDGSIFTTGSGVIQITGSGSSTASGSGIYLGSANLTTDSGAINLTGYGTNGNESVELSTYSALNAPSGTVTITGNTDQPTTGVSIYGADITAQNVAINANIINISNGSSDGGPVSPTIAGNGGILSFQAASTSTPLTINLNALNVFSTGGFSQINLGRSGDTGSVSLTGGSQFSFSDPVTIWSQNADFTLNTSLLGTNDASITIEGSGSTTTLNADITTTGTPIYINDSVILGANTTLDTTYYGSLPSGADITITGDMNGTSGTEALYLYAGSGAIDLQGAIGTNTAIGGLTLQGSGINLPSAITIAGGNLTVDGLVTLNQNSIFSVGTGTIDFQRTLDTGGFDLTLRGNEIDFSNGAASVVGNLSGSTGGNLFLEPGQPDWNIDLAGVIINGSLNLTSTDLNALADGFTSITIGRNDGFGNLTLGGNVTFQDPVTLQMPSGAGRIDTTGGTITAAEGLTLLSNGNLTTGIITANGGALSLTSQAGTVNIAQALTQNGTGLLSIAGNSTGSWGIVTNGSITGAGGAISLIGNTTSTEGIRLNTLINSNGGNVSISGTSGGTGIWMVNGGGVDTGGGDLSIIGRNTASALWGFLLGVNSGGLTTSGGDLSIEGQTAAVGSSSIGLRRDISTGTGAITLLGDRLITIGTLANPVTLSGGNIEITDTDAIDLQGATLQSSGSQVTLNSDRGADGGGTISLTDSGLTTTNGATIALTGNQINLLGSGTSFTGSGGSLALTAALDTNDLSLAFDGLGQPFAVGGFERIEFGQSTSQGKVNLSGVSSLTIADPFTLWSPQADLVLNTTLIGIDDASLTIEGSGNTTTLSADLITNGGEIYFNDSIILGTDVILDTTNAGSVPIGADITITGTIAASTPGGQSLTLNAGDGSLNLGGIDATNLLNNLTLIGGSSLDLSGGLAVVNDLTLNIPITITTPTVFSSSIGTIALGDTLTAGANDLTFTADNLDFTGGNISGSGNLTLQPTAPTATVNITNTNIAALADGFSSITIGRSDGSGLINFVDSVTFNDPVTLQAPTGDGSVNAIGVTINTSDAFTLLTGNSISLLDTIVQANPGSPTAILFAADADGLNGGAIVISQSSTGSTILSGGGNITLAGGNVSGTGFAAGTVSSSFGIPPAEGVKIFASTVDAEGGNITIRGQGLENNSPNPIGVSIDGASVVRTSGTGTLGIIGQGGGYGFSSQNVGIALQGGSQVVLGLGIANLTGTGGVSSSGGHGIWFTGGSTLTSDGAINLTGTGDSTSPDTDGIRLENGSNISSTGAIVLDGTGNTTGIGLQSGASITGSGTSTVSLTGTNLTSGDGISLQGSSSISSDNSVSLQTAQSILLDSSSITSGTGVPVTVNLNPSGGGAIALLNSVLTSNGGTINLGSAGTPVLGSDFRSQGILLSDSSLFSLGGAIGLYGTGATTATGTAIGIDITGSASSSTIAAGTGSLTLIGRGGSSSSGSAEGIRISTASSINTNISSSGAITLTGTGGNSNYGASGIDLATVTLTATDAGTINLTGTSGTASADAGFKGIYLRGDTTLTSNSGTIALTGTGGSGSGNFNEGILVGDVAGAATILSSTGAITLTGTGQATGTDNNGLDLSSSSLISTGSPAGMTLTGTGASGSNSMVFNGVTLQSTAGGLINLVGNVFTFNVATLEGNGTGELRLTPQGLTEDLTVTLNSQPFQTVTGSDFSRILIGDTNHSGLIRITSSGTTFSDPLEITSGQGAIDTTGADLQGTDNATIVLTAANSITTGSISTPGQSLSLSTTATGGTIDTSQGVLDTSNFGAVGINGGTMTIVAEGEILLGDLLSQSAVGTAGTGGAITVTSTQGDIKANLVNGITSNGDLGDGGTIQFTAGQNISLTGGADMSSDSNSGNGGTILLTAQSGLLDASGLVVISSQGSNGGAIVATSSDTVLLGDLNTSASGLAGDISVTAPNLVQVGNLTVDGSTVGTAVTLTGDEIDFAAGSVASATENATLTLLPFTPGQTIRLGGSGDTGATALDLTANDLAGLGNGFSDVTIASNTSLSSIFVDAPATFRDPTTFQFSDMTIDAALTGIDNASLTLTKTTTGSGNARTVYLNADITTIGEAIFIDDRIILGSSNAQILTTASTATGADITVTGTIDGTTAGAERLSIDAGIGTVQVGGAIGDTVPLGGIFITGSGFTVGNNITTINTTGSLGTIVGFNTPTSITAPIAITAQQGRFVSNNLLDFGSNDITFIVGGLRFLGGDSSVTGTGILNLQPFTPDRPIALRGLEIDDNEVALSGASIAALADGFTQINLGDPISGSSIFFIDTDPSNTLTLRDPFVLQGQSAASGGYLVRTGIGASTFTLTAQNTGFLTGEGLAFVTEGSLSFTNATGIAAGLGTDTLVVNTGKDETIALADSTALPVLGSVAGINFAGIEVVEAQGTADQLLGTAAADTIVIGGSNSGSISGGLVFSGIENIDTGAGDDSIVLLSTGTISGALTGGEGTADRLDFSQQLGDLTVDLSQIGAEGIEVIIGNATGTITDPVSTLLGPNAVGEAINWTVTDPINGTVIGAGLNFGFSGFNVIAGGDANDVFSLSAATPLSIVLDGGGGIDQLDYSTFSTPIVINLADQTASGIAGFRNLEGVLGGTSASDLLQGTDSDNTFTIAGANQGNVNGTFSFSSIENLQGGVGNDTVSFQPGAQLSGNIEGGEGTLTLQGDRLDWSGFVSGTGQLNLQPLSSDRPIRLGENTGSSTTLELSVAALSSLQGFSSITVGLPLGNGLISGTGALTMSSPLTLQSLGSGGAIDLTGATLTTPGTSVTLLANQSIQTNLIATNGGALSLTSNEGSITSTGTLQTSGSQVGAEVGGNLTLIAPGAITTGDLNTSANTGGNLQVQSQTAITTGAITTRGLNGSGGNVLLDPPGDVQVSYIDARGTTQGGNVSITTGSLFRATGLIPGTLDSISTAGALTGSATGGAITITHNGVSLGEFFLVSNGATNNGTVGGISSGNLQVPPGQYGQTFAITRAGSFNRITGVDERPNINLIVEGSLIPTTLFEEEGGCPPDCISEGRPVIDVATIVPTITSITELSVEEIETEFTDEVAEYNGVDRPQPRSLPQIQGDLQAVEDATGVKPAIIYVLFTPTTVNTEDETSPTAEKVSAKAGTAQPNPVPEVLWEFSDSASPLNLAQAQLPSAIDREILPSDELEVVLVTAKGNPIRIRVAGANRSRVEQAAALLRQEISDPSRTGSSRYLQPSRLLYNWIIRPLETALEENEIDNLVFVMESGLRSIPVAALHNGEQFLIEKYSAGLMPSLSLTDTRYQDIRQVRLLGMGASQFEDQSDLPTVPLELSTIAGEIWRNGEYYLNEDFTIENLRRRSQNFGIIHLATHADFLPGSVENSYIALSRERISMNNLREFGWQSTDPETDPAVELLTLSACKTAIGSEDAELGFAGLAVQAGVKSALASLWYVSDAATTGLMTKFYEVLADSQTAPIKAEALRQAQLAFARGEISVEGSELRGLGGIRGGSGIVLPPDSLQLLNDRELSHPYYWASFTLVGSPW
ncbi:MAG: hypothetical protein RLZZ435_344, partial [Cyanobacteriota bacterium]